MMSRVSNPIFSNRGLSLAGLVVAMAVGTVLSMMIATLLNQIFRNSAHSMVLGDANDTAHFAQLILSNKALCGNALRDGSGNKFTYNPAANIDNVPVGQIHIIDTTTGLDTVAITSGAPLNAKLKLNGMTLQERVAGFGRSSTTINTAAVGATPVFVQYKLFNSQLVLAFSAIGTMAGGTIPPVNIPITVAVNETTQQIDYCYRNDMVEWTCQNMGGTINPATGNCQNTIGARVPNFSCSCPGNPAGCQYVYYVSGFQSDGTPICNCDLRCP
jgi:hypothetical protein